MSVTRGLHRLARAHGVQTAYYDLSGERVHASAEALLAVLTSLGVPVRRPEDADEALALHRLAALQRPIEPVVVAWDGATDALALRVPGAEGPGVMRLTLADEHGATLARDVAPEASQSRELEGLRVCELRLPRLTDLSSGYHELTVEAGDVVARARVISAPRKADTRAVAERSWGAFMPTYALHDGGSWGCGDLTRLSQLADWVADRGGGAVATLPLLASFLGPGPFEPSPYSPASRLAWNELYVDLTAEPEWEAARHLAGDANWVSERDALGHLEYLEYERLADLRRPVLGAMADALFASDGPRRRALRAFLDARPDRREYARFRAVVERRTEAWPSWPDRLAGGEVRDGDFDPAAFRRHAYAQFIADGQLARLAEHAAGRGVRLVLDLPLGVHPDGFDTWRHPELFAQNVSVGAPPDDFFTQGQDWGFPPPLPDAQRADGYRYLAATLAHHLEHAGVLRIDHILGFHRLYWIPRGMGPKQGVYVRRQHEELYAILCLESARHGVTIVGEDLGTVPRGVRPAMSRHGIQRLHVLQFSVGGGEPGPGRSPAASVAGLNTHDLPSFASFHDGLDIDDFRTLGIYDAASARSARERREALMADLRTWLEGRGLLEPGAGRETLLRACLVYLAQSPAPLVLVNLEDLWLEERPVNVPGTHRERPNWRRRARHALPTLTRLPAVLQTLEVVDACRRRPVVRRRGAAAAVDGMALATRLSDMDVELALAGRHESLGERLGSRPLVTDGVAGVHFAIWAPDAASVSVFGDFDGWDPARHPLQRRAQAGLFEGFVPGARRGALYKFRVTLADGTELDRPDPVAVRSEPAPGSASRVWGLEHDWADAAWMARPPDPRPLRLATVPAPEGPLDARDLVDDLWSAARLSQSTAVVLPPLMDARDEDRVAGAFASAIVPQDLMRLVAALHRRGLAAWMRWPAPSPRAPIRSAALGPWSGPVASLVLSSAAFWIETYHLDGLLVDAEAAARLATSLASSAPTGTATVDRSELVALLDLVGRRHPRARLLPTETPTLVV